MYLIVVYPTPIVIKNYAIVLQFETVDYAMIVKPTN